MSAKFGRLPPGHELRFRDDPPSAGNHFHYWKRGYGDTAFFRGGELHNGSVKRSDATILLDLETLTKDSSLCVQAHKATGRGGWCHKLPTAPPPTAPPLKDDSDDDSDDVMQCDEQTDVDKTSANLHNHVMPAFPDHMEYYHTYSEDKNKKVLTYPVPHAQDFECHGVPLLRPRGANMGGGMDGGMKTNKIDTRFPSQEPGDTYPDGPQGCGPWYTNLRQGKSPDGTKYQQGRLLPQHYRFDPLMEQVEQMIMDAGKKRDVFGNELRYTGADGEYKQVELPCDETPVSFVASLDTLADAMGGLAEWTHYFTEALVQIAVRGKAPLRGKDPDYRVILHTQGYEFLSTVDGRWSMMERLTRAIWVMVKKAAFGAQTDKSDENNVSLANPVWKYETIGNNKKDDTNAKQFFKFIISHLAPDAIDTNNITKDWLEAVATTLPDGSDGIARDAAYETLFAAMPGEIGTIGGKPHYCITAGPPPNALCVRLHAAIRYTADALMACVSREFLTPTWKWPEGEVNGTTLSHSVHRQKKLLESYDDDDENDTLAKNEAFKWTLGCSEPLMPELHCIYQQARCFAWTFPDAQYHHKKILGDDTDENTILPKRPSEHNLQRNSSYEVKKAFWANREGWVPFYSSENGIFDPRLNGGQQSTSFVQSPFYDLPDDISGVEFNPNDERDDNSFSNRKNFAKFHPSELSTMWSDVEPGIPPGEELIYNERIITQEGGENLYVKSRPALEVLAPRMPLLRPFWMTPKRSIKKLLKSWQPDFYDFSDNDEYSRHSHRIRTEADTGLPEDDTYMPIFQLKKNHYDWKSSEQFTVPIFNYTQMLEDSMGDIDTNKEFGLELVSKVGPCPPRRRIFYESMYNASSLSWLRCYIYETDQVADFTAAGGDSGRAPMAMVSCPQPIGNSTEKGHGNKSTKSEIPNHLLKMVEMSSYRVAAVANSNSIFCDLLLMWMTRSGITRDGHLYRKSFRVDSNAAPDAAYDYCFPFDRYHTAYPEPWMTTEGEGISETVVKTGPDAAVEDALKGYGLQFEVMTMTRAAWETMGEKPNNGFGPEINAYRAGNEDLERLIPEDFNALWCMQANQSTDPYNKLTEKEKVGNAIKECDTIIHKSVNSVQKSQKKLWRDVWTRATKFQLIRAGESDAAQDNTRLYKGWTLENGIELKKEYTANRGIMWYLASNPAPKEWLKHNLPMSPYPQQNVKCAMTTPQCLYIYQTWKVMCDAKMSLIDQELLKKECKEAYDFYVTLPVSGKKEKMPWPDPPINIANGQQPILNIDNGQHATSLIFISDMLMSYKRNAPQTNTINFMSPEDWPLLDTGDEDKNMEATREEKMVARIAARKSKPSQQPQWKSRLQQQLEVFTLDGLNEFKVDSKKAREKIKSIIREWKEEYLGKAKVFKLNNEFSGHDIWDKKNNVFMDYSSEYSNSGLNLTTGIVKGGTNYGVPDNYDDKWQLPGHKLAFTEGSILQVHHFQHLQKIQEGINVSSASVLKCWRHLLEDDRPFEVRSDDETRERWRHKEWMPFQSQEDAAEKMGMQKASVSGLLSGWIGEGTKSSEGWSLRWAEPGTARSRPTSYNACMAIVSTLEHSRANFEQWNKRLQCMKEPNVCIPTDKEELTKRLRILEREGPVPYIDILRKLVVAVPQYEQRQNLKQNARQIQDICFRNPDLTEKIIKKYSVAYDHALQNFSCDIERELLRVAFMQFVDRERKRSVEDKDDLSKRARARTSVIPSAIFIRNMSLAALAARVNAHRGIIVGNVIDGASSDDEK